MTYCDHCNIQIPLARMRAVPHTTTCIKCSKERPYMGFMDWHHKTAPTLVMIPATDTENIRRARRLTNRSR